MIGKLRLKKVLAFFIFFFEKIEKIKEKKQKIFTLFQRFFVTLQFEINFDKKWKT